MREAGVAQEYVQVQVRTATPDQLLLLLLDGAVRFTEGARERIRAGDREGKHDLLIKAQNIVLELIQSLSPSIGEKIYGNLIGLYRFIHQRLVEANLKSDLRSLEDGLQILGTVREMWKEAVETYRTEQAGPKPEDPAAIMPPGLSIQA